MVPFLDDAARRAVDDAVERARTGRARVLVLGEAKRGKTSLVNALAGAELLPTGALPLTSVATVVRIGDGAHARARALDGSWRDLAPGEVTDLVSERGNPGNRERVDHVEVVVRSDRFPPGTEIVDTPGTGSVHELNTVEADRAREVLDLALLVVSVDPPISRAELDLLAEAHGVAARSSVVVNKTDLVESRQVDEVVGFTRAVVADRLGEMPVFALSARTGDGVGALHVWLGDQLREHGADDARASVRALLRRLVGSARERVRVERELGRSDRDDARSRQEALEHVLERARDRTTAARDRIEGEARRLRAELDEAHAAAVRNAVAAARSRADAAWCEAAHAPPERTAAAARSLMGDVVEKDVRRWFEERSERLRTGLRDAAAATLGDLRADLTAARSAAGDLLALDLADVDDPGLPAPREPPAFTPSTGSGWEELVTASVARHLPSGWRQRCLRRDLDRWVVAVLPRPYGQARSLLQGGLEAATRAQVGAIDDAWERRLAALERGLAAVRDAHGRTLEQDAGREGTLVESERSLDEALALLDAG